MADIAQIVAHIASDNPVAARNVARRILAAGDSLVLFPRRGRSSGLHDIRELVAASPYVIVYRIDALEMVTILRVWHGAQDRA